MSTERQAAYEQLDSHQTTNRGILGMHTNIPILTKRRLTRFWLAIAYWILNAIRGARWSVGCQPANTTGNGELRLLHG
ncbi:hypothetical protein ACFQJ8_20050, partial [Halocatena marina]